jgi:hypothetical protein
MFLHKETVVMTGLSFDKSNNKNTAGCHLLKKELNIT